MRGRSEGREKQASGGQAQDHPNLDNWRKWGLQAGNYLLSLPNDARAEEEKGRVMPS